MTLAQKLNELRTTKKLSYRAAAAGIGISVSTLHEIEHGAMPRLNTAASMAKFYEVTLEELAAHVEGGQA